MSYFIDTKYLNQIGHRLPLFKKKKVDLWNCRCIICGDSKTNPNKARGYFYRQKNDLYYICHNCLASQHFGTFLKHLDSLLYQHYVFERYSKGENGPKAHTKAEQHLNFPQPVFKKKSVLEKVAVRLSECDENNEAVKYCRERKIPEHKLTELYYIDSVKNIVKIAPEYTQIQTEEPRLLIPFYNENDELTGVSMRALRGEHLRYITIKLKQDETLIFGMNNVDTKKPITIVEGPIDSLFIDNCLACAGTGFGKIEQLKIPREITTIVFDNQPRNREVANLVEKYIDLGYKVCIWPCHIAEKDINDMILANRNVQQIINEYTYEGLMAKIKFTEWRNC